jgi:hypothetical protein
LTSSQTFSGSSCICRFASLPTWMSSEPTNITTEGVTGSPSRLLTTTGRPYSSTREMHE